MRRTKKPVAKPPQRNIEQLILLTVCRGLMLICAMTPLLVLAIAASWWWRRG